MKNTETARSRGIAVKMAVFGVKVVSDEEESEDTPSDADDEEEELMDQELVEALTFVQFMTEEEIADLYDALGTP